MPISTADFWKLVTESRLLRPADCQKLHKAYAGDKGADGETADALVAWLVTKRAISRYQAKILLAGRAGPFVFGDYKVYDRIGSGRLAGLFKAMHAGTNHPVCLFFLTGPAAQDPQLWSFAVQQVAGARLAQHPNLSRCYELIDQHNFKFVSLEKLAGDSLAEKLAKGPQPAGHVCRWGQQAALALAQMHRAGQLHGEIRPANVLLDESGTVKLLQLPLSRDPATPLGPLNLYDPQAAERVAAAADYLAPELAHPGQAPDVLSDIYALGCTVYHLLAGRPPFPGGDIQHKMARHAAEPIQPLDAFGAPPQLGQVVAYLMAKDANYRYRDAGTVAEALGFFASPSEAKIKVVPTQAVYDQWLAQKYPAPAASSAPTPSHAPSFAVAPQPVYAGASQAAAQGAVAQPAYNEPVFAVTPDFAVSTAPSSHAASARRPAGKQNRNRNLVIGGVAGALVLILGIVIFALTRGGDDEAPAQDVAQNTPSPPADETPPTPENGEPAPANGTAVAAAAIADDGKTLFAPPTSGQPIGLDFVPRGPQIIFSLRPADLLAHPEGKRLVAAAGPLGQQGLTLLEDIVGVPPANVEQLLVTLHDRGGVLTPAMVARLKQSTPASTLEDQWEGVTAAKAGATQYYQGANWSYYMPVAEQGKTVVVARDADIQQIIADNAPPALNLGIEGLIAGSDAQRHFTLLLVPTFLHSDGRAIFAGPLEKLVEPSQWFLGDPLKLKGCSLSFHVSDSFYAEMRILGQADTPTTTVAEEFAGRLKQLPDNVESYLIANPAHPYAARLLFKFPHALRHLTSNARVGADEAAAVLQCYLPAPAGEHLLMGSELALAAGGGGGGATAAVAPATSEEPKTVADKLKKKISLTFARDGLEKALEMLGAEIGVTIKIRGGDLQLEGITRNQQLGLDERDKPAGDILRTIMAKADPAGRLVYLIKPPEGGGEDMIFISTRAAATKNKEKLPPELEVKKP